MTYTTYNPFAPNGWHSLRTAEQRMQDAMTELRKQRYGLDWYKLDLWGRPIDKLPEYNSNTTGRAFVRNMARTIARGF